MNIKVLCTVWTEAKIDEEQKVIPVKGYDYVRIGGSALLKTPVDENWRKYDNLYDNWKSFQLATPNKYPNTNEGVLGWMNYNTYRILNNELKQLKVSEEEDEKWKQSGDTDLKTVHGVTLRDDLEIHALRIREREVLIQAIGELEMWHRTNNLDVPNLEAISQGIQMQNHIDLLHKKRQEELEAKDWEITKQKALRDSERIENENLRDNIIAKAPLLFSEITDTQQYRMIIMDYLRENHGQIKATPNNLRSLPKGIKQKARDFLMLKLGNKPNASDICDNVFKKPRRVKRNQDNYRIGDNSEESS